MKQVFIFLALVVLGIGVGCASLSEYITPATVDQKAVEYAANAGIVNANDFTGFANLEKAIRLETAVDAAHQLNTLAYQQLAEKDQVNYDLLKGATTANLVVARQREETFFGSQGLLSMGLSLLGVGGAAGLVGLMRKRPGDITPQEMEQAVTDVKGEVTQKDRQFIELVKGVQKFLDAHDGDPVTAALKVALGMEQSVDTKQAVAVAKATIV
jgi:hypothetical protein